MPLRKVLPEILSAGRELPTAHEGIPGVGPIISSAVVAAIGNGAGFNSIIKNLAPRKAWGCLNCVVL
jgi:hypothetical protein